MPGKTQAYIAEGQLWLRIEGEEGLTKVQSRFGEDLKERLRKMRQKNEWKSQGTGAGFMNAGMLWGASALHGSDSMQVSITSVASGGEDELFFVMTASGLSGIFSYQVSSHEEQRLYHGAEMAIHAIDHDSGNGKMICSVSGEEGLHNLALYEPSRGGGLQEITEGDSLDTYPRWVPGKNAVIYQTAGIGRNSEGDWVATAPCEVARLDFESGEIDSLLDNPAFDHLLPQMDANRNLYCIRRPYEATGTPSITDAVKDTVLFPFRILRAGYGFLNFFSSVFTGKPLSSAGAERTAQPDTKRLILYGNLVDAEKVMRENSQLGDEDLKAAVPSSWKLVRYPEKGEPAILAEGVMAYSVSPDGDVHYSNGRAVFHVSEKDRELVLKRRLVQQIAEVKV